MSTNFEKVYVIAVCGLPFNEGVDCIDYELWLSCDYVYDFGLGMAVKHCVRAYLGPHCILAQKQYCQKLMVQLNSTTIFTPVCVFLSYKTIHEKFCNCL